MIRPMAKAKGNGVNSAKSKHGRSTVLHSRPPLERMMEIHESVRRGNYPNASTLAKKMEVSTKTIHRDIQFMRDRWDLPILYDPSYNGYLYTRTVDSFPMLQINEGELFAMLIAEKALQNYRGTVFEKRLSATFKKIADSLPDTVSIHLNEWDEALSFRHTGNSVLEIELFDWICRATAWISRSRRSNGPSVKIELVPPVSKRVSTTVFASWIAWVAASRISNRCSSVGSPPKITKLKTSIA